MITQSEVISERAVDRAWSPRIGIDVTTRRCRPWVKPRKISAAGDVLPLVIPRIPKIQQIKLQIEGLFLEVNGSIKREIRRRVLRHGLRGGLSCIVRPEMLRTGTLHPEAWLDQHVVVMLDSVIDPDIKGHVRDVRHGKVVVGGARDPLRRRTAYAAVSSAMLKNSSRPSAITSTSTMKDPNPS